MRRIWIVGSLLVVGCAARVSGKPPPLVTKTQPIVVVPVDESSKHPHGMPPGQDPNFVPPGHGGVPPGQAKKMDAVEGTSNGNGPQAHAAVAGAPAKAADKEATEDKKKGKKAKAKVKKDKEQ